MDVLRGAEFRDDLIDLPVVPLLLQSNDKTYLDLIEGGCAEAGLVVVVVFFSVGFGYFRRMYFMLDVLVGREVLALGGLVDQVVVDQPLERALAQVIESRGGDTLQDTPY